MIWEKDEFQIEFNKYHDYNCNQFEISKFNLFQYGKDERKMLY